MLTTSYRGCRISIEIEAQGPHLVARTVVSGSKASPFIRYNTEAVVAGLAHDQAQQLAFSCACHWIDGVLPPEPRATGA